jgi:PKD repeat protein
MLNRTIISLFFLIAIVNGYAQTPVISGFSPTSAAHNDTVTITGNNLQNVFLVRFGGINMKQIVSVTATTIKVIVGFGATGEVKVISPQGNSGLPGFTFLSPITANFTFPPGVHYAPAEIQFTDVSTAPSPLTSWLWDYNDGSFLNLNPTNPHYYPYWGNYEVKLTVTTATDTASVMKLLQVFPVTQIVLCTGGGDTLKMPQESSNTYQWQTSTDSVNYTSITDNANYTGTNTHKLILTNMTSSNYGRMYRCLVNGNNTVERFVIRFENQWVGTTDSTWGNPANWSCGQVPDGNTDVVIYTGPVLVSSNAICRTLYVLFGVSFTVASGVTLTITH